MAAAERLILGVVLTQWSPLIDLHPMAYAGSRSEIQTATLPKKMLYRRQRCYQSRTLDNCGSKSGRLQLCESQDIEKIMEVTPRHASNMEGDDNPPLYQMVIRALKSEILRGVYPVGARLPSENVLVNRFGVSRHTVREALRRLRDLGLVESHQGKGTLVLKPGGPQVYVHQVNSIADLHDYNVESRYKDHGETIVLTKELAERLGVTPGETWLKLDGMRFEPDSDNPICAVEIFVPGYFAGIGRLLGRRSGPVYALIEDVYGESIGEVDQDLRALPLRPDLAEALEGSPGEIAVEIRRVYRLIDGRPAEITFNYYKAKNFSFSMKLRRVRNSD